MPLLKENHSKNFSAPKEDRVIRISNVHPKATARDILHHFRTTNPVSTCRANHEKTKKRTVAFVYFRNKKDRMKAEELNRTIHMGRLLDVKATKTGFKFEEEQIWSEEAHKCRAIRAARNYPFPLMTAWVSTTGEDRRIGGETALSALRAHLDANSRPRVTCNETEREDLTEGDKGSSSDSTEAAASSYGVGG